MVSEIRCPPSQRHSIWTVNVNQRGSFETPNRLSHRQFNEETTFINNWSDFPGHFLTVLWTWRLDLLITLDKGLLALDGEVWLHDAHPS